MAKKVPEPAVPDPEVPPEVLDIPGPAAFVWLWQSDGSLLAHEVLPHQQRLVHQFIGSDRWEHVKDDPQGIWIYRKS